MYTIENAEQVSLIFLVIYYANHFRHRFHAAWRHVRREFEDFAQKKYSLRTVAALLLVFILQGCIEASPVVFYGLHLSSGFTG